MRSWKYQQFRKYIALDISAFINCRSYPTFPSPNSQRKKQIKRNKMDMGIRKEKKGNQTKIRTVPPKEKKRKKKKKNRVNKNYTVRYGTIRQMFVGGKRSRIGKGSLFIHQYEISYRALLLELIMLMSRDLLCSVEY